MGTRSPMQMAAAELPEESHLPSYEAEKVYDCVDCRDTRWVVDHRGARPCRCRERIRREAKLRQIPIHFTGSDLGSISGRSWQTAAIEKMRANPTGSYFLHGRYGSGKTHLLVAQFRELIGTRDPELRSSHALMDELHDEEFGSPSVVLYKAATSSSLHLCWDDVDKIRLTDFRREMLCELIDLLYRRNLGLSLTSNFGLRELQETESLPPAALRRIRDMCEVIEL